MILGLDLGPLVTAVDLAGRATTYIDTADLDLINDRKWHLSTHGYAVANKSMRGASVRGSDFLHRFLTDAPTGTHVDHINGDRLDNRRANLRVVTPSANQVNRKRLNRNNRSGVRGVHYRANRATTKPWVAQITVDRRNINLGSHASYADAITARKAAELRYYGEECP